MKGMPDTENVGIMQGFMDRMMDDEDEGDDEDEAMPERRPDSPEILMNNLRGDMRSIDARRDELADLVGYSAAADTPEPVLAMLQPVLAQQGGLGGLPQSTPMAQGPQPPMAPPQGGPPGMPPGAPPMGGGLGAMPPEGAMGLPPGPPPGPPGQPPLQMARGGLVQHFQEGSDEEGVTPLDERDERMPSEAASRILDPETKAALRQQFLQLMQPRPAAEIPTLEAAMQRRMPQYEQMLGGNREALQGQVLLDLAQRAFGYAANVDEQGRPLQGSQASRMLAAFRGVPGTLAAAGAEAAKADRAVRLGALQAAEKDISALQAQQARADQARQGAILGAARSGMLIEGREDRLNQEAQLREKLQGARLDAQQLNTQYRETVRERIAAEQRASRERSEEARLEAAKLRNQENNLYRQLGNANTNATRREIALLGFASQATIAEARDSAAFERTQLQTASRERIAAEQRVSRENSDAARLELQRAIEAERDLTRRYVADTQRVTQLEVTDRRSLTAEKLQSVKDESAAARQAAELASRERVAAEARAAKERTAEAIQAAQDARQREQLASLDARSAASRENAFNIAMLRMGSAESIAAGRRPGAAAEFRGNWFMPIVTDPTLARAFAAGNTSEDNEARINAAIVEYTKPVVTTTRDPETGALTSTTQSRPLPQAWVNAFRARNMPIPSFQRESTATPPPSVGGGMPGGAAIPVPETAPLPPLPGGAAPVAQPAPAAAAPAGAAAPVEAPVPSPISAAAPLPTRQSLWDVADQMTGPLPAARAAVSQVPGFGFVGAEEGATRLAGRQITESLIEAALKNPRAPVEEQRRLRALVNVGPTLSDVNKFRSNLLGNANTLYTEYVFASEILGNQNTTPAMRNDARQKLAASAKLLEQIAPPIYDDATLARVKDQLAPGTNFLYLNPRTNRLEALRVPRSK
jgi:hypothetical protein